MALLRVGPLPQEALAAAAAFHQEVLPRVLERIASGPPHLLLAFDPADHAHHAWRLAAVQGLARESVPVRINGVASDNEAAIAASLRYLSEAPGVTGQYWPLDATGVEGA
jgi:hypothetical protein